MYGNVKFTKNFYYNHVLQIKLNIDLYNFNSDSSVK